MRHSRARLGAALLAALTLVAGCSEDNPAGSGGPRVTVRLTDAAGDVKAAVVTISEVYLQGSAKVVLRSDPVTTDLVTLANTTATLVDQAEIPAGSYSELRFVITGGYVAVENATGGTDIYASSVTYAGLPAGAQVTGELQMPSLAQSGLKVQFDGSTELAISADQDLLVDFNVSQSFGHVAGNSGNWIMHPVIKGAKASAAATVVATLKLGSGVTLPVLGGSAVTLAAFKANLDGEVGTFSDSDGNGTYESTFRFVLPGTHSLAIMAPAGLTFTTTPVGPAQVDAVAGAQATVAFTLMSALAP